MVYRANADKSAIHNYHSNYESDWQANRHRKYCLANLYGVLTHIAELRLICYISYAVDSFESAD